ncbi:MAG: hypothetical protein ACI8YI_001838 [Paracoccaceae bacterium]|jgi:hypothetical protein
MFSRALVLVLTLTLLPAGILSTWSSSEPKPTKVWLKENPANSTPIDHSAWSGFLQTYITQDHDGLNRLAYATVSTEDKATLNSYVEMLSKIEITDRARAVQRAYWLNLYNALTVSVILDHYPVKSIKDIDTSGLLSNGPWGEILLKVENTEISLDIIEHDILRPIWHDPRTHYGVNCASIGCPNLHTQAFTAVNTEALLDQLASDYINSTRGVLVEDGDITVSKIYQWFAYDFGNSEDAVLAHLSKYAAPELKIELQEIGEISGADYNWALNE